MNLPSAGQLAPYRKSLVMLAGAAVVFAETAFPTWRYLPAVTAAAVWLAGTRIGNVSRETSPAAPPAATDVSRETSPPAGPLP